MFQKILTSALFAGFAAGLIAAALQFMFVQPVLLHAELYEGGDLVHFGAATGASPHDLLAAQSTDIMRDGLSVLFSALTYVGYGLMLVAGMAFAAEQGAEINVRTGIIWGIAGWITAHLAPAFSLPPELPGSAAADVGARQVWWYATVAASAVALWLFAFGRNWAMWGVGIILLVAPHVVGAPQPGDFSGPVPPELAGEFAARALGVGLAVWATLGAFAGYFWSRETS